LENVTIAIGDLNRGVCGSPGNLDKHLGCGSHRDVAQPTGEIVDLLSIFNVNPMKIPSKLSPITAFIEFSTALLRTARVLFKMLFTQDRGIPAARIAPRSSFV
jgi:hypothetical protein